MPCVLIPVRGGSFIRESERGSDEEREEERDERGGRERERV